MLHKFNTIRVLNFYGLIALSLAPTLSHAFVQVDSGEAETLGAADDRLQQGYQQALELYKQRNATNMAPTDAVVTKLDSLGKVEDLDLGFDVLMLKSRAVYWKAVHTKEQDPRAAGFKQAQALADAATKLNPDYADSYYFAGACLARWGETVGVDKALFAIPALVSYMNEAKGHDARNGDSGETVDGYGPDRVLGRVWLKVPAAFGGGRAESLHNLEIAYGKAPTTALNGIYLAMTLHETKDEGDKARAKKILTDLIAADPNTLNKDRIPETLDEQKLARDTVAQW